MVTPNIAPPVPTCPDWVWKVIEEEATKYTHELNVLITFKVRGVAKLVVDRQFDTK